MRDSLPAEARALTEERVDVAGTVRSVIRGSPRVQRPASTYSTPAPRATPCISQPTRPDGPAASRCGCAACGCRTLLALDGDPTPINAASVRGRVVGRRTAHARDARELSRQPGDALHHRLRRRRRVRHHRWLPARDLGRRRIAGGRRRRMVHHQHGLDGLRHGDTGDAREAGRRRSGNGSRTVLAPRLRVSRRTRAHGGGSARLAATRRKPGSTATWPSMWPGTSSATTSASITRATWTAAPSPIGTNCTVDEYGDTLDLMGATRGSLQCVPEGAPRVAGAGADRERNRQRHLCDRTLRDADSGVKALKVLKSVDAAGKRTYYYVEFRQPIGYDSVHERMDEHDHGVGVHPHRFGVSRQHHLPARHDAGDRVVVRPGADAGRTFTDATAGVSITTLTAGPSGATVSITSARPPADLHAEPRRAYPCRRATAPTVGAGTLVAYTVSVTNSDRRRARTPPSR